VQRLAADALVPEAPRRLDALVLRERPADGPLRRIVAAGDTGFSGRLAALAESGHDPFREIAPVLRSADVAFVNLESPFVEDDPRGRCFAAPISASSLLAGAGIRLVNLANNHVLDHGPEALEATRRALAENGIEVLGTRRLVVTDLDGLRVGWLGCARTHQAQDGEGEGFWEYDPGELGDAVAEARGRVDVLAVSVHMGYMYVDYPHPEQRRQVRELLDRGADLVVLHHAHVLQGIETPPGGGLACYNLGNLLLDWEEGEIEVDQMVEEQRSGGLFVFDVDRRGVARAFVLPIRVDDGWTVRWAVGEAGGAILNRLERISRWDRDTSVLFHKQLAERTAGLAFRSVAREIRRGGVRTLFELMPRLRAHHVRMVGGWLASRLKRGLERTTRRS
jgi:poly-gamma-glutamate synthesis protein (capsule biosynthesis protein)